MGAPVMANMIVIEACLQDSATLESDTSGKQGERTVMVQPCLGDQP